MAQQDIVSARMSSFAQLLMAVDKLLEPSAAEKQANELTNMIRAKQMELQMGRDAKNLEQALNYAETDADQASDPEMILEDFSNTEAQHRFGFYHLGKWTNGPLVKKTNPGEITRSIWNPMRYVKGSHDKLVNPVTTVAAGLAVYYGGASVLRTSLRTLVTSGANTARLKLIQKLAPLSANNPLLKKELAKHSPQLLKAYEKMLPALKAQSINLGSITFGMVMSEMSGVSDYLASTPSFFDKNRNAQSRNSWFQPTVLGDNSADLAKIKKLYHNVSFSAEQGVAMPESRALVLRKLKEMAPSYSMEAQAGLYLHHELYTNYKDDEMIEYQEGKYYKTSAIRALYEEEGRFIAKAIKELEGYGSKQGYGNIGY